jgi:hypothetical protein
LNSKRKNKSKFKKARGKQKTWRKHSDLLLTANSLVTWTRGGIFLALKHRQPPIHFNSSQRCKIYVVKFLSCSQTSMNPQNAKIKYQRNSSRAPNCHVQQYLYE